MTRLILASLLASAALPAQAQLLFLDDATVVVDGEQVVRDVLVDGGELKRVTERMTAPNGARTIDGAWVTPGLFAVDSTMGLVEIGAESATDDRGADTDVSSVANVAADAFNPRSPHVAIIRRQGVTHTLSLPSPRGDTIFGGFGLVADTSGGFDSVKERRAALHVVLGESGAGMAGGSRAAAFAQLRGALNDLELVSQGFREVPTPDYTSVLPPLDAGALLPVASGEVPMAVRASRASDIVALANLKAEFPDLDVIVFGAEEAYLVADQLADADMRYVVDPLNNLPDSFESAAASFDNYTELKEAGLDVAIANTSSLGVTRAQALRQHAGNAVARGADWHDAFEAISSVPAGWFGVEDTGLVVWDSDPLEVTSAAVHMILGDESLSLESRQTLLRDRYNPTVDSERPHKYR